VDCLELQANLVLQAVLALQDHRVQWVRREQLVHLVLQELLVQRVLAAQLDRTVQQDLQEEQDLVELLVQQAPLEEQELLDHRVALE